MTSCTGGTTILRHTGCNVHAYTTHFPVHTGTHAPSNLFRRVQEWTQCFPNEKSHHVIVPRRPSCLAEELQAALDTLKQRSRPSVEARADIVLKSNDVMCPMFPSHWEFPAHLRNSCPCSPILRSYKRLTLLLWVCKSPSVVDPCISRAVTKLLGRL